MNDTLPHIRSFLESTKLTFEVIDCDPALADTNIFCKIFHRKPSIYNSFWIILQSYIVIYYIFTFFLGVFFFLVVFAPDIGCSSMISKI